MPTLRRLLRFLLWTGLVVYFAAALAYLGLRYWAAPRIDVWRPYIVEQFSQRFGVALDVKHVQLSWSGSGPSFVMQEVQLRDGDGGGVLALPKVKGSLSWRGLWRGELSFRYLEFDGLEIAVHRDQNHTLTFFSDSEDDADQEDEGVDLRHPLVQWLSHQKYVVFRDASLIWSDDTRDGTPLRLADVTLEWLRDGETYRLGASAQPPTGIGEHFSMSGAFTLSGTQADIEDPKAWDARLYIRLDDMVPQAWRTWVDIPQQIESGLLSAQWWLDIEQGEPKDMAVQAHIEQGHVALAEGVRIGLDSARAVVRGDWQAYMQLYREKDALTTAVATPPLSLSLAFQGLDLTLPEVFESKLRFGEVALAADLLRDPADSLALRIKAAHVVNDDMDVSLWGRWQEGAAGTAGWAELQGRFERASMAAIQRYLPLTVEAEAREWMRTALLAGQVHQADFLVRGELDEFPFGDEQAPQAAGAWRLDGRFSDAIIDYVPPEGKEKGWPRLEDVSGVVAMRGNDLRITAQHAQAFPEPGKAIKLSNVQAHIPDLSHQTTLHLQGDTEAPAPAYLALMRTTPLGSWLDNLFDATRAEGLWRLPLQLSIPLLDADATRVRGQLTLNDTKLWLFDGLPVFEKVKGELEFSEWGGTTKGLEARFLGGPVTLKGGLGKGQKGLGAVGRLTAAATKRAFGLEDMKQITGELNYQMRLELKPGGRYGITASSDLVGLTLALPHPLSKSAAASWPMGVSWMPQQGQGSAMSLLVDGGRRIKARFLRDPRHRESYFRAAAIGVGRDIDLPQQGMVLEAVSDTLDVAAWERMLTEAEDEEPTASGKGRPTLWPALKSARIQAQQVALWGLSMSDATLTARQEDKGQWRVDVSSHETAGTLYWSQAGDADAGKVRAHFTRLSLDAAEDKTEDALEQDEEWGLSGELDLPGVQLLVDDLVVVGRHLGRLTLDGINVARGRLWRLDSLTLESASASLSGQGEWRLDGPDRGLTLAAAAQLKDAGAYLNHIGMNDVLQGGQGTLDIQLKWRNLPWRFKVDDLSGTVQLDLHDGRFSAVQSRSVKLLELLSMQSLQRMFSLDLRPGAMFSKGFPFDHWSGTLHMDDGVIQTNDYRVEGAAGTISLAGSTRWDTEALDLQAMVVPKLDVSGATLAAGLVVNPVVGIGAFLTQWMLKEPLARAMTVHYEVKGTWKDPQMKEVSVSEAASDDKAASE
ncbi:TIGR02099 family protein [Pusillimonas sp. CC-YST705]|uniref:TIGR02099 family protein n=1 Tax=Mesopusillimonas faecipullorum TaxID=2755040 RepID=A0ABS8CB83_9BURK|nr:YhdP family protein [Mesopusillimonas faecipullorum]MCB5363278.1 TIGR02099 family protein [Mesopusillimonas faecipullorum]